MKPEPVSGETVCSACGLPWQAHGDPEKVTLWVCVRLLKAELAKDDSQPMVPEQIERIGLEVRRQLLRAARNGAKAVV